MISRKNNKKGFTLMEMLIVVAIIVILIAIMIPTFNGQLEKTREAADAANIRATYAELMVQYLDADSSTTTDPTDTVKLQQTESGWKNKQLETNLSELGTVKGSPAKGGNCKVTVSAASGGAVTFDFGS